MKSWAVITFNQCSVYSVPYFLYPASDPNKAQIYLERQVSGTGNNC